MWLEEDVLIVVTKDNRIYAMETYNPEKFQIKKNNGKENYKTTDEVNP